MKIIHFMRIIVFCSMPVFAMEFNNGELEKVISTVWADFIGALIQEVKHNGIGKAQIPQELFVPVLQAILAKADVRAALRVGSPSQQKEFKTILERVLTNTMSELCNEHVENEHLEVLYQLLATISKLDDLYARYYGTEDTRKTLLAVVDELAQAIKVFEVSTQSFKKRAEKLEKYLDAMYTKFSSSSGLAGISGDIHNLNESLISLEEIFDTDFVDTTFSLLKECVASIAQAIDLIQKKYGIAGEHEHKVAPEVAVSVEKFKKAYKLLFVRPAQLSWCTCPAAPFALRIALIIRVGQDAKRRFSNYRGRFVYTSIGSGSHLQDYLTIQELRAQGFDFLDVNLIELDTKDIKDIHAMIDHPHSDTEKIHAEFLLDTALNQAVYTAALVKKLNAFMWHAGTIKDRSKAKDRGVYITLYQNANSYLDFAMKHPEFKSHLLLLVDPNRIIFTVSNLEHANAVVLVPRYEPMPFSAPSQSEIKKTEDEGSESESDDEDEDEKEVIEDSQYKNSVLVLLPRSAGIEVYTTIKKPYDIVHDTFFRALTEMLQQEKVATQYVPTLGMLLSSDHLRNELKPYARNVFSYMSWWVSNAYIAFHDIVVNALAPQALLYQTDCTDFVCHSSINAITDIKKYLAEPIIPQGVLDNWKGDYGFGRWYPDVKLLTHEGEHKELSKGA